MRKLLKLLLWLVGFLVLTLVIVAIALPIFFDPNDYKPQIVAQVQSQTGRSFAIEGPIEWTVFPWLALSAGPIILGNDPDFGNEPFLHAGRVSAGLRVWPLLKQRLEVGDVELEDIALNLAVDASGRNNWDSLAEAGETTPTSGSDNEPGYALSVASFTLDQGTVHYVDTQSGTTLALNGIALTSGTIRAGAPLELDLSAGYELNGEQRGNVSMAATVRGALGEGPVRVEMKDVRATQDAEPRVRFQSAAMTLDLGAGTLAVPAFEITSHEARLIGDLNGRGLTDQPAFSGKVQIAPFAPDAWLRKTGLYAVPTTDPDALDNLEGEVEWRFGDALVLHRVRLQLDQTLLRGSASMGDALSFELNADKLDLDRYLPPTTDQPAPADDAPEEPLTLPKMSGVLTVGEFKMAGLSATEVLLKIEGDEDGVQVLPIRGRAYGGQFEGSLDLRDARKEPVAVTNLQIKRVDGGALLESLAGESVLTGLSNLDSNLTIRDPFSANPLASLNGDLRFEFSDGKLYGVNVMQIYRQIAALGAGRLDQLAAPAEAATDFAQLILDGNITDGVLDTREFRLVSPIFEIAGAGRIDLGQGTMDYQLTTRLTEVPEGESLGYLDQLAGREFTIPLRGSITNPTESLDKEAIVKRLVGDAAKERVLEELGVDANEGEDAKDALKSSLFDALRKEIEDDDEDNDNGT